jgi:hypothetical protein
MAEVTLDGVQVHARDSRAVISRPAADSEYAERRMASLAGLPWLR